MHFDEQKLHIDKLIDKRLRRLREHHARDLAGLRAAHRRELDTLRIELARARAERGVLATLADKWFRRHR